MTKRFAEDASGPLASGRSDRRRGRGRPLALGLIAPLLAAALASAEPSERIAQAGGLEPPEAEPRAAAEPASNDPSRAEPISSDPIPTEPISSEPDSDELITTDPNLAEPRGGEAREPSFRPGIDQIIVVGAESEGSRDFQAADSVVGFGAEDLAALGVQNVADIAAFTPNLEVVNAGTTPTFFIRGVGLNDFNSNSTGSVALYRDDVPINAQALQTVPLFDVEEVNVLRGPQGTGLARNASAGAIKVYSRKPTGEYNAFLRSEIGNFDFRNFEGAVETPILEDLLAGRLAFRLTERDGTMKNRCGNAPAYEDRVVMPDPITRRNLGLNTAYIGGATLADGTPIPGWSICGEPVLESTRISQIPEGLPDRVNDWGNWAARGMLLFQPTLDMSWLVSANGSRRDEQTRLGQSIGTRGFYCADGDFANCGYPGQRHMCVAPAENAGQTCRGTRFHADCDSFPGAGDGLCTSRVEGVLGGKQGELGEGYRPREIQARLERLAPCFKGSRNFVDGTCDLAPNRESGNAAKIKVANELAESLDSEPWEGDFNVCTDQDPFTPGTQCQKDAGKTLNDTWGGFIKGEIVLPMGMELNTVTAFDAYDRLIDNDLDYSPETLFQIRTEDEGWQAYQDLRLEGLLGDDGELRWDVGGWFLREQLDVTVTNDLGLASAFAVGERDYTQDVWSIGAYASVIFDFWKDFTLDGGVRYNWERKKLNYSLVTGGLQARIFEHLDETWDAPTGSIRLTYRFRDDTHAFWTYTRGWKPGHYNATSSVEQGVSIANPETIDSFETGLSGRWFDDRVGLDFSFFYYSYQNYQLFTAQQFAGGQPEFVIINANDAEVYGAEATAEVRPWFGAYAQVNFGWLESQFTDFVQLQQEIVEVPGALIVVNRELQNTGNNLLNSPRFKISLTGEQEFSLGPWGKLTARYDAVWTDKIFYDATEGIGIPNNQNLVVLPEQTISQPAYWMHHLRLTYQPPGGRFEISGWVRNLTNESTKAFAFDGSTFNQTTIYFVNDPRTYGGTLVINF